MTKASARQNSAMISVYHYTDEVGFKALSSGAAWIPSTGLTIDPNTPFDIHLTCSVAAASLSFYVQQWNQCDFRQKSSTQFRDINYGPGWYLTNLPPSTSTNQLLDALWLGNREFADRTTYWLRVLSQDVVTPDDERPSVKFLPVYQSRRADTNNPFGGRTSPVLLVDAGMRREERAERVDVKVLRKYEPAVEVVPPFQAVIDGWTSIDIDSQCNILGFMGLDSGFPAVPFPEGVDQLQLKAKQFFAISQIAIRSLGSNFRYLDGGRTEPDTANGPFRFDFRGELALQERDVAVSAHCTSQKSPVRAEQIEDLAARSRARCADVTFLFAISSFAENGLKLARQAGIQPILVTSRTPPFRNVLRIAIDSLDGEVIRYPAHSFWHPVVDNDISRFDEIRRREQILETFPIFSC